MIQILLLAAVSYAQVVSSPQATRVTQSCQSFYYWTGQSCMPCQTSVANGQCLCTSATDCTPVCNSGYTVSGSTCVQTVSSPDPNCLTFGVQENSVFCYSCKPGYTLIGNVCVNNGNCNTVSPLNTMCWECKEGFYFNWINAVSGTINSYNSLTYYQQSTNFQCSPCMTGCKECQSAHTCVACANGYFWQMGNVNEAGSCVTCQANCRSCNSTTQCLICNDNYYLNSNNNNNQCQYCAVTNCLTCSTSKDVCYTCKTGFNLSSNGSACNAAPAPVACQVSGCDAASCNGTTCTKCQAGYAPVSNNSCYQCSAGCQTCSRLGTTTSTTCDACYDTYYRVMGATTNDANSCKQCSSLNSTYLRCQGQSDSPAASGTTVVPTQCANNYFLVSGQCVSYSTSPINTCLTLIATTSNTNCQACQKGYTQIVDKQCASCSGTVQGCQTCENKNGAIACTTCMAGRFLASATACTACSTGCMTCTSATACTACIPIGYYLANATCTACNVQACVTCSSSGCSACQPGYFLQANSTAQSCNKCPTECATCTSPGNQCATCITGYVLQKNGCVSLAQANCAVSGTTGCTTCAYGFYLNEGICFQTVSQLPGFVEHSSYDQPSNSTSSSTSGTAPANTTTSSSSYSFMAVVSLFVAMLLA